jgi:hypothetical protein
MEAGQFKIQQPEMMNDVVRKDAEVDLGPMVVFSVCLYQNVQPAVAVKEELVRL